MNSFSMVFLSALALTVAVQLWLGRRQVRPVHAHRRAVPVPFRRRIPLTAHHKAADYTVARTRFGLVDGLIGALYVVGLLATVAVTVYVTRIARAALRKRIAH